VRVIREVDTETNVMTLRLQFDTDSDPESAADRAWELTDDALRRWQADQLAAGLVDLEGAG
jgi:hypothetical protein